MPTETVTQQNSPEGYIVLTAVVSGKDMLLRVQIPAIIAYQDEINPLYPYTLIALVSGDKVHVKETPDEIDTLIDRYQVPPFRCHSPAGRFFG